MLNPTSAINLKMSRTKKALKLEASHKEEGPPTNLIERFREKKLYDIMPTTHIFAEYRPKNPNGIRFNKIIRSTAFEPYPDA